MKQYDAWLIKEGEPLPVEGAPGRVMRCGIIAEMLVDRGCNVTWWTSDFYHQKKCRLNVIPGMNIIRDNYNLYFLHAKTVYKRNVSIERVLYSIQLAKEFKKAAKKENKPNVIICSCPLIDFAFEAVKYGKRNHIPVVIDIRDFWPDIWWERYSGLVSKLVKCLTFAMRYKISYAIRNADIVIGTIPKSMEFAEKYGRVKQPDDMVCYLAYKERHYSSEEIEDAERFVKDLGIVEEGVTTICYIGQLTKRCNIRIVAEALKDNKNYRFVVCGDGSERELLENQYRDNKNIIFTGFIGQNYLEAVMRCSTLGVIPIEDSPDFADTINNKVIEYMAGSLCIATKLKGIMKELVEKEELGFYFTDTEDFKKNLEALLADREKVNKTKNNARKYYEENFKSENVYGKLIDCIEKYIK